MKCHNFLQVYSQDFAKIPKIHFYEKIDAEFGSAAGLEEAIAEAFVRQWGCPEKVDLLMSFFCWSVVATAHNKQGYGPSQCLQTVVQRDAFYCANLEKCSMEKAQNPADQGKLHRR